MYKHLFLAILALLPLLGGCRKDHTPDPPVDPLSLLPRETQTGAKTFGSLLNGQAWTPAGSPLAGPLLTCSYLNSRLVIVASRNTNVNGMSIFQRISIVLDKVHQSGIYTANDSTYRVVEYEDFKTNCTLTSSTTHTGTVTLTKLDPVARIASGRFTFSLEKPGCDRAEVTNGRFDCAF